MTPDAIGRLGAVVCALLAAVVLAPSLLVAGVGRTLAAYYAAGPFGLSAVGFLALLGIVVFLAAGQEHTDTATVAGVAAVVAVAALVFAAVWALALDPTVLYSFPARYAWLAWHRWVVVAAAVLPAAVGVLFARAALGVAPRGDE